MSSATANEPFVFTPGVSPVAAVGTDSLINETRREISEIVREVAIAVRSQQSADDFLGLLVDRILRAMAAEGVMVWQREQSGERAYRCARRLGRITDQSIPAASNETHQRLLCEVAHDGQPVVVPATPGATDKQVPANPMEVPVALVPIECEPMPDGTDYLLEVFLEPGCGVATQRGYLRFVAQMADLAGEFLRADQLRVLRRNQKLADKVDATIRQLHELHDRKKLEARIVDRAVDLFGFDRVGLCIVHSKVTLSAVSHVTTIDTKSPAARQLCAAAEVELDADGCAWINESSLDTSSEESTSDDALVVAAVVSSSDRSPRRLVCMRMADAEHASEECRSELIRYVQHAELALDSATRLAAIPGGRLLASLAPAIQKQSSGGWRPAAIAFAAATLLIAAAMFPVPLVVYSPASIRPAIVQTLTAPRDSVVDHIHVRHGQQVSRGEKLLTLVDPSLEEQITSLVGQRAVMVQQESQWTASLVDRTSHQRDQLEQLQGERGIVAEKIQSTDAQLALLRRAKQSLELRADRDGIVDAWQIQQRLQSRPLRRGDPLVKVIAKDSPWLADVQVAQTRIAHVQDADSERKLTARVSLEASPNDSFDASLLQIGPAITGQDTRPSTAVLLRLGDEASRAIASRQGSSHPSGAPARVIFHCGKTPAAHLIFQDVIRSLRGTLALYFASDPDNSGDS